MTITAVPEDRPGFADPRPRAIPRPIGGARVEVADGHGLSSLDHRANGLDVVAAGRCQKG